MIKPENATAIEDETELHEIFIGWDVQGKHIHPLAAYANWKDWFDDFCSIFPDKEKRMKDFCKESNIPDHLFRDYWFTTVVRWLNWKCKQGNE